MTTKQKSTKKTVRAFIDLSFNDSPSLVYTDVFRGAPLPIAIYLSKNKRPHLTPCTITIPTKKAV